MANVLVIADRPQARWGAAARKTRTAQTWTVLPLGTNGDVYQRANEAALAGVLSVRYVSPTPYSETAQTQVRDAVPLLVEQLAHTTDHRGAELRDSLRVGKTNLWWSLEFTEKSAFRGRWIQHLYTLAVARQAVAATPCDELWIDTDDAGLAHAFRHWAAAPCAVRVLDAPSEPSRAAFYAAFFQRLLRTGSGTLLRAWACRLFLSQAKTSVQGSIAFFSFYPFFWDNAGTVQTQDRFFGEIPARLAAENLVTFLAWLDVSPLEIYRNARTLTDVFKTRKIRPLQALLDMRGFFRAVHPRRLGALLAFSRRARHVKGIDFQGFDIAGLWRQEINRCLTCRELWMDALIHESMTVLLETETPRCVALRSEFQPYEVALADACRGKAPLLGFQHAAIGRNHLSYRWSASEASARPAKPDYFICTGDYAADLFKSQGIPADRLGVCGPARYRSMFRYFQADRAALRRRHNLPVEAKVIFIGATVVWDEVRNILETLKAALANGGNATLYALFKCHPAADFAAQISATMNRDLPGLAYRVLPHGVPTYEFIAASNALISAGSTLSLEALCLDVMPIVFEDTSRFSVNPMLEARGGVFAVHTAEELRQALDAIAEGRAVLQEKKREWPSIIRDYFLTLEGDPIDRFVECMAQWKLANGAPDLAGAVR